MSKVEHSNSKTAIMSEDQSMEPFVSSAYDSTLPETIFKFTDHVKVDFDEVFDDPKEYKETNVGKAISPIIKNVFGTVYDAVQAGIYYVFALIFGLFLGILWGLLMGINNFFIVWLFHPMYKLMFTYFRLGYLGIRAMTRMTLDPCFESVSLIFSGIRGRFSLNLNAGGKQQASINF